MAYLIYLRKSRVDIEAEAHGEGETLSRHRTALTELAKRQHLQVGAVYEEIVSGETVASRPKMQQLLSEVEQGLWEGVLVMEVERLARGDTIDQGIVAQAFKFSNTKIITPTKTYDPNNEFDEEYFEFGLFMSRREYKTINRRLQRGRLASVQEGKYVGSKAPYGYRRKKLEHEKGYTLEPIPEQAEIVRMIFDLYVNGENGERLGASKICRKLNRLHIAPQNGELWVNASVDGILRNPVYAGKIRWNWRPVVKTSSNGSISVSRPRVADESVTLIDGLHEAIVSQEIYETTQNLLHTNPVSRVPNDKVMKNPLSGLVVCGMCGRKMIRRPKGPRCPYDLLMCAIPECDNVASKLEAVEQKVILAIEHWILEYTENHRKENKIINLDYEIALKNVESEILETEKQLDKMYDLLERGVYDDSTFFRRSGTVKAKLLQLRSDKDQLEAENRKRKQINDVFGTLIPKMEYAVSVYWTLDSAKAKNDLLKEVLEKVVYTKHKGGRWGNPDDFEVVIFPKDYSL